MMALELRDITEEAPLRLAQLGQDFSTQLSGARLHEVHRFYMRSFALYSFDKSFFFF